MQEHGTEMKQTAAFLITAFLVFVFSAAALAEIPQGSLPMQETDSAELQKQKTEYNDTYHTLFSVIASAAAYEPENSEEVFYLRDHGWAFTPRVATEGKTTVHFLTAKSRMADGTPLYVIAFRGSADKKDWAADFKTGQVVYGGATLTEAKIAALRRRTKPEAAAEAKPFPKVHKGFHEYANAALRELLASEPEGFLEEYRNTKGARLLLTGHSLGGAVATIVGQRLIDFGFDAARIQVITFGAPAVANKTFRQMYGDRLNLIRVVNTADPVPLTLQAVLRNYKQFGKEVRFRIPRTTSDMTHFMNLYLDAGLRNYYQYFDKRMETSITQEWPDVMERDKEKPTVLLYVKEHSSGTAKVKEVMPVLQRFMLNEYKALFPNYIVIRDPEDPAKAMETDKAEYLLELEFEANASREDNSWFLSLTQTLADKEGTVLAMGSVARRTSPEAGNILAAMEAVRKQKAELKTQLPWLYEDKLCADE